MELEKHMRICDVLLTIRSEFLMSSSSSSSSPSSSPSSSSEAPPVSAVPWDRPAPNFLTSLAADPEMCVLPIGLFPGIADFTGTTSVVVKREPNLLVCMLEDFSSSISWVALPGALPRKPRPSAA